MKRISIYLTALFAITIVSCSDTNEQTETTQVQSFTGDSSQAASVLDSLGAIVEIPRDSANKMVLSYLNSINYTQNDSSLRSLIVDANVLRAYLNSPSGLAVSKLKISFAHTLDYINNGGLNQNCGYTSGKLTVVLAGFNSSGNYVYLHGNVMDRGAPCPSNCPTAGTAVSDTFPR